MSVLALLVKIMEFVLIVKTIINVPVLQDTLAPDAN